MSLKRSKWIGWGAVVGLVVALLVSGGLVLVTPGPMTAMRITIEDTKAPSTAEFERAFERNRVLELLLGPQRTWVPCELEEIARVVEAGDAVREMKSTIGTGPTFSGATIVFELDPGGQPSEHSPEEVGRFLDRWLQGETQVRVLVSDERPPSPALRDSRERWRRKNP